MSTPSLWKSTTNMEDSERLRREYQIAIIQHQNHMIDWALFLANRIRRMRGQRRRAIWVRPWIGRRQEFGIYDQPMMELRNEDPASFTSFLRLPPGMFDELLDRVAPRITKMYTRYREPVELDLKLSITLRHLASGNKYASRKGWRVRHNTISIVVREVCLAIIHEYKAEVLACPNTHEGWRSISDKFYGRWNLPHTLRTLDGKHVACCSPPGSRSLYFNCK